MVSNATNIRPCAEDTADHSSRGIVAGRGGLRARGTSSARNFCRTYKPTGSGMAPLSSRRCARRTRAPTCGLRPRCCRRSWTSGTLGNPSNWPTMSCCGSSCQIWKLSERGAALCRTERVSSGGIMPADRRDCRAAWASRRVLRDSYRRADPIRIASPVLTDMIFGRDSCHSGSLLA